MKKIAIFASGGGSNFKAIYEKIKSGDIPAEISIVVSNNPNCGAFNFAEKNALPTFIFITMGLKLLIADFLIHLVLARYRVNIVMLYPILCTGPC